MYCILMYQLLCSSFLFHLQLAEASHRFYFSVGGDKVNVKSSGLALFCDNSQTGKT